MIDFITNLVNSVPSDAYIMGLLAVAVSTVLQFFKGWLRLQSEKWITVLLVLFSFVSVAVEYLLTKTTENPAILGQNTLLIMGLTTPIYRYLIKPITLLIQDAKEYRKNVATTSVVETVPQPISPVVSAPIVGASDEFSE